MYTLARLTAEFIPADGGERRTLVLAGYNLLREQPAESMTLPADERAFCEGDWGETVPSGNAKLTLTLCVLLEYMSVAQLEANIRERQLAMATCRHGILELSEAYHMGVPLMRTRWHACCVGLDVVKLLPSGDALGRSYAQPTLKGKANGQITYTFHLWQPERF